MASGYPSVNVAALVIQLVCYPLGIFMAHLLPSGPFINPGPFNSQSLCLSEEVWYL